MLRIVFDSNVYISALLFKGIPAKILNMAFKNEIILITSGEIITETVRILREKFKWPEHNIDKFVRRLSDISVDIRPQIKLNVIKERESDNRVLECAVSGDASLIVSGDKHLLKLKKYKNIPIVRPVYLTYLIKEE
ncbi:MAG: putative toxin-antitoxin system toxin component, PIN family [Actinobacteria bacterium]|nr:putative toxin-antitoxin system toxin component, PIN family [Cyanobacteriota bacterium]MCL6088294.1 putative toxin-antitoxin system toxin component, PIN family [Actinomycetota bacterium]